MAPLFHLPYPATVLVKVCPPVIGSSSGLLPLTASIPEARVVFFIDCQSVADELNFAKNSEEDEAVVGQI